MSKSSIQKIRRRKEIRSHDVVLKNNVGKVISIKHPAYIFLQKYDEYIYVTITHAKSVKNYTVIKLRKNPNPNDNRDSYYVTEIRSDNINKFGKRKSEWSLDKEDDLDIRRLYKNKKR